jgi:hypothetical protein
MRARSSASIGVAKGTPIVMAHAVLANFSCRGDLGAKHQPSPRFRLDVRTRLALDGATAEEKLVNEIEVTIFAVCDDLNAVKRAGQILARILRFDECDENSLATGHGDVSAIAEVHNEVFENGQNLRRELTEGLGIRSRRVLVIDRVEISAEFHRRSLGRAAVDRLIDLFGEDGGAVLLMPFPLQWDDSSWTRDETAREAARMGVPQVTREEALQKLRRPWSEIGFRRLGAGDYYALNPEFMHPVFAL